MKRLEGASPRASRGLRLPCSVPDWGLRAREMTGFRGVQPPGEGSLLRVPAGS